MAVPPQVRLRLSGGFAAFVGERELSATEQLLHDLRVVSSVARRAQRRMAAGALDGASAPDRARAREQSQEAYFELERLVKRCERETAESERQEKHA